MKRSVGICVVRFLIGCSLLCSCAGFDSTAFRLERRLAKPLPPLKVWFDEGSVEDFFMVDQVLMGGGRRHVLHPVWDDVREIVRRELHVFSGTSELEPPQGELNVRMTAMSQGVNGQWLVPMACSLSLLNLMGLPVLSQEAEVGLEITVKLGNEALGTYPGMARVTEWGAFFWGYSPVGGVETTWRVPLTRATVASAAIGALKIATRRMQQDADRLHKLIAKRLKKPGPSARSAERRAQ
ncbi:hypothetical protein ACFL59_12025 [Planctomycetota bacterium]